MYTKKQFGLELKSKLLAGDRWDEISKWAFQIYLDYISEFESGLGHVVLKLVAMEEGSEFLLSEEELRSLANELIGEEAKKFNCRVCGWDQGFEPWGEDGNTPTFDICDCCGVQFGYEDCNAMCVKKLRDQWIKNGAKWVSPKSRPENWSLEDQLKHIPDEYADAPSPSVEKDP